MSALAATRAGRRLAQLSRGAAEARGELLGSDSEGGEHRPARRCADDRGDGSRDRRRGLDPGATLADEPAEARGVGVPSDRREAIGRERAQTGPRAADVTDVERGRLGEHLQRPGDVLHLGRGVDAGRWGARRPATAADRRSRARSRSGRRRPSPAATMSVDRGRHDARRPAQRPQAERRDAGERGDDVAPRSGGVDDDVGGDRVGSPPSPASHPTVQTSASRVSERTRQRRRTAAPVPSPRRRRRRRVRRRRA